MDKIIKKLLETREEIELKNDKLVKFSITRVYTKDILTDSFQSIRNFFGLRLRRYEDLINKGTKELIELSDLKYKRIKWYRLNINPLTKGSIMITIYGEGVEYE